MGFLTKIWESIFNTHEYDTPVHTMKPVHEWPTVSPFETRSTMKPTSRPPLGAHWTSKPPDIKTEPPSNAVAARESGLAFSLEKVLWVFLSGFGIIVLMAVFMKLGGPIRRVRRQLSTGRPAHNDVITATLRPDDANLALASLLRSRDDLPPPYCACARAGDRRRSDDLPPPYCACARAGDRRRSDDLPPPYCACARAGDRRRSDDLPPPYCACARSGDRRPSEEPPPRFSACFVSVTIPKDAEPQVHIRQQDDLIKNGLTVDSVPMNNSENVAPGIRTELVFDNGRIVESLK